MDLVNWPGFIAVAVFVICGLLAIVFRERLARWNARMLRDLGGKMGAREARRSTASQMALAGAMALFVGIAFLLYLLFRLPS